jgi:putative ABC transport system permease protein
MVLRETRSVGKASTVWIQSWQNDAASQLRVANLLRKFYEARDLDVSPQSIFGRDTAAEITQMIVDQFNIIASLLAVMAIVIGAVGGIALSGVLSLSVLERRREIGVMRAIGASSLRVASLFIGEGLFLGWLSWLIALPLSIPAGYLTTQALGAALDSEIIFKYSPTGALYWLGIITMLSIAASWLPSRNATRISVRESLAYQ